MKFNKKFLFPVIFSALNAVFYAQNSGSDIFSDQKFIEQKETKAKALGLFSKKISTTNAEIFHIMRRTSFSSWNPAKERFITTLH